MLNVYNSDGHLVCRVNKISGAVEIRDKKCVTLVERPQAGIVKIKNFKKET